MIDSEFSIHPLTAAADKSSLTDFCQEGLLCQSSGAAELHLVSDVYKAKGVSHESCGEYHYPYSLKLVGDVMNFPSDHTIILVGRNSRDSQNFLCSLQEYPIANEVIALSSGQELMEYLYREGNFALRRISKPLFILLDFNSSQLGASEVLLRLKDDSTYRDVPIVLVCTEEESKECRYFSPQPDAVLIKPVTFIRLRKMILQLGLTTNILPRTAK